MRKCSNCFQMKPFTEFYRKQDGYQSRCKKCNNEVVAAYRKSLQAKEIAKRWEELRGKS